MQVGIRVIGHVEVEDDVDLLNVNATREYFRGNQETELELLESLVDFDSI